MSHIDDDDLALIALGESASPIDRDHLQSCAQCQERVAQYAAIVTSARSITEADRPVTPPDSVWSGIVDELSDAGSAVEVRPQAAATVTSITSERSRRSTWLIGVAAGVVGVALGAVIAVGILSRPAPEQIVASAALSPIADSGFSGSATVTRRDGEALLTVSVPGLPAVADGYYEVWMATPDTATMVAIGTLSPGAETIFTLPAGMEVGTFPVVDVSVEQFDGDTGHSDTSVVRGLLDV